VWLQYALVEFHKQLASFRDNIIALGYDGTNCTQKNDPEVLGYKWSFMGSLLFATTVFTTVGQCGQYIDISFISNQVSAN